MMDQKQIPGDVLLEMIEQAMIIWARAHTDEEQRKHNDEMLARIDVETAEKLLSLPPCELMCLGMAIMRSASQQILKHYIQAEIKHTLGQN